MFHLHNVSIIPQGMEVCLIDREGSFFFVFVVINLGLQETEVQILSCIRSQAGGGSSSVGRMFA